MITNNISWLMTTPSGDCNFKSALDDDYEKLYKPFKVIAWKMLPEPYLGQV